MLAGLFRLPLTQYVEFKGDEALNLFLAARPVFSHPFPPASQASSAGILNFPLLNYLLFPIVVFTLYPPIISFIIALLNTLTVGGFFLLFKKYHGKNTAFFASCILALSPWAILYSRKIWAQDFLLPLSLPFFYSLYKITEGKKQYWFLFGLSSMLLTQLHQLAILIPLALFVGLLVKKQKIAWRLLVLGIIIGLIPTVPYFWYAFSLHFSIFKTTSAATDRFSFHTVETFLRPLQIISIGNFHTEMGNDFALFAQKFHSIYIFSKASYIAYLLLPFGAAVFWMKNKKYRFLIPSVLGIIIFYFVIGVEPLMHYYILLMPFFALFLANIINFSSKKFISVVYIALFLYLISLALYDFGFLKFLSEKGGFAGDYGSGFATSEKSAKTDLQSFSHYRNYKEIEIYYYAPMEYFHGFMPVGKMVFPHSELVKNEPSVEKHFTETPTNPLLATQVFAYYTQNQNPSWDYVFMLKEKTRLHSEYNFIYQKVLDEYLGIHFKNLYETADFLLLYPKHWSKQEIPGGVELTDGTVGVDIIRESSPSNLSTFLRANYYSISIKETDQKTVNNRLRTYAEETLREIKDSIRALK